MENTKVTEKDLVDFDYPKMLSQEAILTLEADRMRRHLEYKELEAKRKEHLLYMKG